jgi:hypothetical protein
VNRLAVAIVFCLVMEAMHISGLGEFLAAIWFFWPEKEPERPITPQYQAYLDQLPGGKDYSAIVDRWESLQ